MPLLRPLWSALLGVAVMAPVASVRATPSLGSLEAALNSPAPAPLAALLEQGPGLQPGDVERRRDLLRQRYPDAHWTLRPGLPLKDGRPTVELEVRGSRRRGAFAFQFQAQQRLVLSSHGQRFNGQEVLSESSMLRSGDPTLQVSLLIPDVVLTGQRYDLDVIFDEPLDGAVAAGAIQALTPQDLHSLEAPDLQLEALGGGGLFKTVQAPYEPGTQTWAMVLVHPRGIVSATKRVRVVADRAALQP